ncbi:MAG: TIGR02206 family membrane protein [Flavobacteriales bacterium]|nr:TIGR02206 family membrane protein [Flavobacteriales bacterium]
MIQHEIITPFSNEWWIYNLITISVIICVIIIGKNLSKKNKNHLTISIAALFIFEFLFMEAWHLVTGVWNIHDSLPLHLCSVMWFIAIYVLLSKKKWAFEILLFIGMPGGIHSLLTPELTHGDDLLHKIDFFLGHGGLVLVPFYALFVLDMWPRKFAWLHSFIKLQALVIAVGICNYFFESNYMYLMYPPIANNPLIPPDTSLWGKWPYYILIFELAVLIHAIVINIPFYLKSKK